MTRSCSARIIPIGTRCFPMWSLPSVGERTSQISLSKISYRTMRQDFMDGAAKEQGGNRRQTVLLAVPK
jgi:hypothetical protein